MAFAHHFLELEELAQPWTLYCDIASVTTQAPATPTGPRVPEGAIGEPRQPRRILEIPKTK